MSSLHIVEGRCCFGIHVAKWNVVISLRFSLTQGDGHNASGGSVAHNVAQKHRGPLRVRISQLIGLDKGDALAILHSDDFEEKDYGAFNLFLQIVLL